MRRQAKAPADPSIIGSARASALAVVVALLFAMALGATSASAVVPRSYVCQITGSDTPSATECNTTGNTVPGGAFGSPFGVTVDPDDNVWVSDNAKGLVDKFDSDGNFVLQADGTGSFAGSSGVTGLGYGNGADRLFVGDWGFASAWGVNPDGSYAGMRLQGDLFEIEFREINVAVDNSSTATDGFVYAATQSAISRFSPDGAPSSWDAAGDPATSNYLQENLLYGTPTRFLSGIVGLAVLPNGNIAVADGSGVTEFKPTGEFSREVIAQHDVSAIAVDPTNGNFLLGIENGGEGAIREYTSSGKFLAQIEGSTTPAGTFAAHGLAVDSSGRLYSTDGSNGVVNVFGPAPILPKIAPLAVSNLTPNSVTLNATVDPDGVALTECEFEWGTDETYGEAPVPCTPDPGSSSDPVAVHADLSGLDPDTTYHYRVHAANANGDVESDDSVFGPPLVKTSPAALVTDTSALLGGKINPQNSATSYHVEYSTAPDFASSVSVPAADTSAGSGDTFLDVVQKASGLIPGTRYYFRVLATNPVKTTVGSTGTFVTLVGPAAGPELPDGRVYERASPADKHGADLRIGTGGGQGGAGMSAASEVGDAVAFWSININFGGDGNSAFASTYISRRGPEGWSTTGIAPPVDARPALSQAFGKYDWLSPDLSKGIAKTPASINPGDPKGIFNLYLRDTSGEDYQLVTKYDPGLEPAHPEEELNTLYPPLLSAATPDGSHIVFQPLHQLTANGPGEAGLYEWANGTVRPVGVMPDGTMAPEAVAGSTNRFANLGFSGFHLLSDDGSRIYFTIPRGSFNAPGGAPAGTGPLYVRVNGSTTQHVSISEAPGPDPSEEHVHFELAEASDGSVAFFTDDQKRTMDAVPGRNLYRWDASAPEGSRLTDITTGDPDDAGVVDVLGTSDDATHVYFRSTGVLAPGGIEGRRNIYLWQEGQGVRYVAEGAGIDDARTDILRRQGYIRVTPDGSHILFESRDRLTAYDNGGFTQLYLYGAADESLACVSCNPRANSSRASATVYLTEVPFAMSTRNISSDGKRVFFNSSEALVPQDTNGHLDVYEWEDGRARLISSGSGKGDSEFLDASASGNDVFFTTSEPLVRSDTDQLIDVYDARVGGTPEPPVVPGCLGDECQGTPKAPPVFNNPSTSTYSGPGNQGSGKARCGKGKRAVKKEGKARCVRKHKRAKARTQRQQGRAGR